MLMNKRPTTGDHQMAVGWIGTPSPTGVNNIAVRAVIITFSTANIETLKKKKRRKVLPFRPASQSESIFEVLKRDILYLKTYALFIGLSENDHKV